MKKYREYLEDVYLDVTTDEIKGFDFSKYAGLLADVDVDDLQVMKAHIVIKTKLAKIGIQTSGGTIGVVNSTERDSSKFTLNVNRKEIQKMKKLVDVKTVKELLAENEQFTEADIYRFYDVKDDGTKIVNIYSGGEEAGIAGVEYEDGTYYVVGCRTDCRVGTFDDMITLVEESI